MTRHPSFGRWILPTLLVALPMTGRAQTSAADANSAFLSQDWATAAAAYQRIAQADSTNGMAWLRLGTALVNLGQQGKARAPLARAMALGFNPMMVHMAMARVAAWEGKRSEALEHVRAGVELGYSNPRVFERDSNIAAMKGNLVYDSLMSRMNDARYPCRSRAEHRQFDFWLGTWNVLIGGSQVGVNTITRMAEGCVILEDWNSPLQIGNSINFYDIQMNKWRQIFVYDNGGSTDYVGELRNGKMIFETRSPGPNGVPTLSRMTFTPISPDSLTQVIESSNDGGKTWTTPWNSLYVRRQ